MGKVVLVDKDAYQALKPTLREHIEERVDEVRVYSGPDELLEEGHHYFLFLSDHQIRQVLKANGTDKLFIGFLPHPKSTEAINGFKVPTDPKTAFDELLEVSEESAIQKKLLCQDDSIILNYAVLGEISGFVSSNKGKSNWWGRMRTFFRFARKLKDLRHQPLTFHFKEKEPIETCATDVLIVQNAQNASISRLLVKNKGGKDQSLFHTFVFAPRSVIDLLKAYIIKLLLGSSQKNKDFDFLSQFVCDELRISSPNQLTFYVDREKVITKELLFHTNSAFNLLPSKEFEKEASAETQEVKELYQTKTLPKGNLRTELIRKKIPFISHASTDEYKELFVQLRENARPSQNYVVLMTLSTILATFGVFADSSPVIIGAMILAPLMAPIISLSMGVLRQDRDLIKGSVVTVLTGIVVGYIFAIGLTFITPINNMNAEITSRIKPNIIDLGIAVISGAAGAYAYSKESIAKTLAGVAIAVALVPPLAVSGIGLAWGEWNVFLGALLLLLTNLTGMVLAAALTFLFTGYSPFSLARKGLLISSFVVLSISIPLGYGFFKVVKENRIIQSLSDRTVEGAYLDDVKLEDYTPTRISLNITVSDYPSEEKLARIKDEIEQIVGHDVTLEIGVRLKR